MALVTRQDDLEDALRAGTLLGYMHFNAGDDLSIVDKAYDKCIRVITQSRDATLVGSAARQLAALCRDPDFRATVPDSTMKRLDHIVRATAVPSSLRAALYVFFAMDEDPIWRNDSAREAIVRKCLEHFASVLSAAAAPAGTAATSTTAEAALRLAEAAAVALEQPRVQERLTDEQLASAAAAQTVLLRLKPTSKAAFQALLAVLRLGQYSPAVGADGEAGAAAPPAPNKVLQRRVCTAVLNHGGVEALLRVMDAAFEDVRQRAGGGSGGSGAGGGGTSDSSDLEMLRLPFRGTAEDDGDDEDGSAGTGGGGGGGGSSVFHGGAEGNGAASTFFGEGDSNVKAEGVVGNGSDTPNDLRMEFDGEDGGASSSYSQGGSPEQDGRWYGCYIPDECPRLQMALSALLELLTVCSLPSLSAVPDGRRTNGQPSDRTAEEVIRGHQGGCGSSGGGGTVAAPVTDTAATAAAAAACEAAERNANGSRVLLQALLLLLPLPEARGRRSRTGGGVGADFGGGLPPSSLALLVALLCGTSAPGARDGLLSCLEQQLRTAPPPSQEPAHEDWEQQRHPVSSPLESRGARKEAAEHSTRAEHPSQPHTSQQPQQPQPPELQQWPKQPQPALLRDALLLAAGPLLRPHQPALPAAVIELLLQLICRAVDCDGGAAVHGRQYTDVDDGDNGAPGVWLKALASRCPEVLELALALAGGAAAPPPATSYGSAAAGQDQVLLLPVAVQLLLPALRGLDALPLAARRAELCEVLPGTLLEQLLATPAALARRALQGSAFTELPEDVRLAVLELLSQWLAVLEPLITEDRTKEVELCSLLSALSPVATDAFGLFQARSARPVWLFKLSYGIVLAALSDLTFAATRKACPAVTAVEPRRRVPRRVVPRAGDIPRGNTPPGDRRSSVAEGGPRGPGRMSSAPSRNAVRKAKDASRPAGSDSPSPDPLQDMPTATAAAAAISAYTAGDGRRCNSAAAAATVGPAAGSTVVPVSALRLAETALIAASDTVLGSGNSGGRSHWATAVGRGRAALWRRAAVVDILECLKLAVEAGVLFWRKDEEGTLGVLVKEDTPPSVTAAMSSLMEAVSWGVNAASELLIVEDSTPTTTAAAGATGKVTAAAAATTAAPAPTLTEAQRLSALQAISKASQAVALYERARREAAALPATGSATGAATPPAPGSPIALLRRVSMEELGSPGTCDQVAPAPVTPSAARRLTRASEAAECAAQPTKIPKVKDEMDLT